jgi:hypothetical protein
MSVAQAQTMLDNSYGIDWVTRTTAGTYYGKNGIWSWNGQEKQGVTFFLLEDMAFVLLVKSPVGT